MRLLPIPDDALTPFDPATIASLGRAFEAAWQSVVASGNELASSRQADQTREELVMRIIEMAKRGERDVARLRDGAVEHVLNTDHRKQAEPRFFGSGSFGFRFAFVRSFSSNVSSEPSQPSSWAVSTNRRFSALADLN